MASVRAAEEDDGEIWDYPDFWFIAADSEGRQLEHGPIPEAVRPFFTNAGEVLHAEVYRTVMALPMVLWRGSCAVRRALSPLSAVAGGAGPGTGAVAAD